MFSQERLTQFISGPFSQYKDDLRLVWTVQACIFKSYEGFGRAFSGPTLSAGNSGDDVSRAGGVHGQCSQRPRNRPTTLAGISTRFAQIILGAVADGQQDPEALKQIVLENFHRSAE
jgi:hypothetical protein